LLGLTTDTFWALTSGTVANLFRRNPQAMSTQRYLSGSMLISLGLATALAGASPHK
jgi:threonine/homoserine/homoserine lactone efflux protein